MRPETAAGCLAALPGLLLALTADLVDRSRLRARVGGRGGEDPRAVRRGVPRGVAVVALGAVVGLGGGFVAAGPVGGLVGGVGGAAIPILRDRRATVARARLIDRQLAPAAGAVAAGLRAGRSILGSIRVAADEVGPPLGPSLREVVDRASLGTSVATSLDHWARGIGTPDARLLVGVLRLHAKSGGEMPAALDRLSATLRARAAAVAEVRSLTSQARLSGAILGLLPVGFLLFLSATSKQDVAAAIHSGAGVAALGCGLALEALAFLWIRRLLRVEP